MGKHSLAPGRRRGVCNRLRVCARSGFNVTLASTRDKRRFLEDVVYVATTKNVRVSRCGPTAGGSLLLDLTQLCTPETDTRSGGIWDNVNIPPLHHLTLINDDVIDLADQNSPGVGETSDDKAAFSRLASRQPLLRAGWSLLVEENPEDARRSEVDSGFPPSFCLSDYLGVLHQEQLA